VKTTTSLKSSAMGTSRGSRGSGSTNQTDTRPTRLNSLATASPKGIGDLAPLRQPLICSPFFRAVSGCSSVFRPGGANGWVLGTLRNGKKPRIFRRRSVGHVRRCSSVFQVARPIDTRRSQLQAWQKCLEGQSRRCRCRGRRDISHVGQCCKGWIHAFTPTNAAWSISWLRH